MNNGKFLEIDNESLLCTNGGGIGGVIVGACNGFAIGLVTALGCALVDDSWNGTDTGNIIKSCTFTGVMAGLYLPL